tara:strand:+ start:2081 stop:2515 length:435 start_codon:yes stop_codon:yes gene_type:complete
MENKEGIAIVRVTLTLCATIIVIGLGYKTMKLLGIIPDLSEGRLENNQAITPQLYLDNKDKKNIDGALAIKLAEDIKESKGFFSDDEGNVTGAIGLSGSKVNMSFISFLYVNTYKSSLASYITEFTNKDERNDIIKALNKLPKF